MAESSLNEIEVTCAECGRRVMMSRSEEEDPPDAVRLVFHECGSASKFHHENAKGERL